MKRITGLITFMCLVSVALLIAQVPARAHDKDYIPAWGALGSPTAATVTSSASGNWSASGTWSSAPSATSIVRIQPNHTVVIDGVSNGSSTFVAGVIYVSAGATLRFDPSKNTKLVANTIYVAAGGKLEIGTTSNPVADGYTAELSLGGDMMPYHDDSYQNQSGFDPNQHSSGLIVLGSFVTCGQTKTPFSHCSSATAVTNGSTSISLKKDADYLTGNISPVDGWKSGDAIAFPDSRSIYNRRQTAYSNSGAINFNNPDPVSQSEVKNLSSISTTGSGNTATYSLSLNTPLSYSHPGNTNVSATLTPWVMNLTRNVRIYSTYPSIANKRAHIIVQNTGTVDTRNTEFYQLGRTSTAPLDDTPNTNNTNNHIGRYALHLHHLNGPTPSPIFVNGKGYRSVVLGCAFNDSPKWLAVVHDSTMILVQDNSLYSAKGAAFVTESGAECWNEVVHNFAANCPGGVIPQDLEDGANVHPGKRMNAAPNNSSDFGSEGVGFWLSGAANLIRKNIAADCSYCGILTFQHYKGDQKYPTHPEESENGAGTDTWKGFQFPAIHTVAQVGNQAPIQHNTVYASARGIEVWGVSPFKVYDSVVWNCHIGITSRHAEKLSIENSQIYSDGLYNPAVDPNGNYKDQPRGVYLYERPTIGIDNHYHATAAQIYGVGVTNAGVGVLTNSPTGVMSLTGLKDLEFKTPKINPSYPNITPQYVRDLVIQYGYFTCDLGIAIDGDLHYKKTYENDWIGPSRTYVLNCHFYPRNSNANYYSIRPMLEVGGDKNMLAGDEIWVGSYQGQSNWNYRVYYDIQAPNVIVPHSSPYRGALRNLNYAPYNTDYMTYNGIQHGYVEGLEDETYSDHLFYKPILDPDQVNHAGEFFTSPFPRPTDPSRRVDATAIPLIGYTNQQAWTNFHKAIAGAVAPANATSLTLYGTIGGLVVPESIPQRQQSTYLLNAAVWSLTPQQIVIGGWYESFPEKLVKVDIYVYTNNTRQKWNDDPVVLNQYADNYNRLAKGTYLFIDDKALPSGATVEVEVAAGEPMAGQIIH